MVNYARKIGLTGIAITDHNCVKGSLIALRYAKRLKNFFVIPGSEIKSKEGDIVALGIKEDVKERLSLEETIEKIHELGGIAVAAHPFGIFLFRKCLRENALKADAIEVFNAYSCRSFQNKKALWLAKKFKKPMTAGSDAHWHRILGFACVECEAYSIDDLLDCILKRKVKIFGRSVPYRISAKYTFKKFSRSLKDRILRVF
jgi:hypothetical protein